MVYWVNQADASGSKVALHCRRRLLVLPGFSTCSSPHDDFHPEFDPTSPFFCPGHQPWLTTSLEVLHASICCEACRVPKVVGACLSDQAYRLFPHCSAMLIPHLFAAWMSWMHVQNCWLVIDGSAFPRSESLERMQVNRLLGIGEQVRQSYHLWIGETVIEALLNRLLHAHSFPQF